MKAKILKSKVTIESLGDVDKLQPFRSLGAAVEYVGNCVKNRNSFRIAVDNNHIRRDSPEMTVISDIALGNGYVCIERVEMDDQVIYRYVKEE